MQTFVRTVGLTALILSLAACHLVYTPDVQQGNLIGKIFKQLRPGLTQTQVLELLGTPSVISPFNQTRWTYVSSCSQRGKTMQVHSMTLYFKDRILTRIEGTPNTQDTPCRWQPDTSHH